MPYDQIMQTLGMPPGQSLQGPFQDAYEAAMRRQGQGAETTSFHSWLRGVGIDPAQLQPDQVMSYYQMWRQMMMEQQQVNQNRNRGRG